jgi:chorismate synthase
MIADTFRPGHADYSYSQKFGERDPRGGGRSSARLTAPTVAAGAIAKKWLLQTYGVVIRGYMSQLGPISIPFESWDEVPNNAFYAPNAGVVPELEAYMDQLRRDGDSIGARIEVVADNVPAGWGEPLYDRLDADIAHAMMGLNAVKGVSIGAGFESVAQRGSEHGDEITPQGFLSNHAGGVLGGISSGQAITVSLAIKPTSSIRVERQSINRAGEPVTVQTLGRHDPCVGIRATPIVEALLAIILMDHALRQRAQCS